MKYVIGKNMNKKILVNINLIVSALTVLALSLNVQAETKLYKWVDSQGRISYQSTPPPENSKILSEETLKTRPKAQEVEKVTKSKNSSAVDLYVNKNCAGCDQVVDLLKTWDVPHNVKLISDHRDIQRILIEKTSSVGVPALFYKGKFFTNIDTVESLKQNLISTGHLIPEPEPEPEFEPELESETTEQKSDRRSSGEDEDEELVE